MSDDIVIIGSGFAARQLVKNIRKQDPNIPLTLIAADSMDEYNKPDLSHVVSRGQNADDLTLQTAGELPSSTICACFRIPGSAISTPSSTW
ncbi:nitric oxide reductase FlRd-NAD(+) reductase [Klebsiella michiganensis]|nr:nitric oxide reductase FlRd-NAD(+) reductase [Klebsiella michiganensis]